MIEIMLEKRYPHSRSEDITDAFMRGYVKGNADRLQGEWVYGTDEDGNEDAYPWTCSICGEKYPWYPNYCPHCGARMVKPDE